MTNYWTKLRLLKGMWRDIREKRRKRQERMPHLSFKYALTTWESFYEHYRETSEEDLRDREDGSGADGSESCTAWCYNI